jgi:hypothetical protein
MIRLLPSQKGPCPVDDRHWFEFQRGKLGIRVLMNDRWWMPPKPFPLGFDQQSAEFDTVENVVSALQDLYRYRHFVWVDDDEKVEAVETPSQFVCHIKKYLGIVVSRRSRRKPR